VLGRHSFVVLIFESLMEIKERINLAKDTLSDYACLGLPMDISLLMTLT
jgi:hypothetical protein